MALINHFNVVKLFDFSSWLTASPLLVADSNSFLVQVHLRVAFDLLLSDGTVLATLVELLTDFIGFAIDLLNYGLNLLAEMANLTRWGIKLDTTFKAFMTDGFGLETLSSYPLFEFVSFSIRLPLR